MHAEIRITDAEARLVLPKGFASATVIVEQVSATELHIRKDTVIGEHGFPFAEESTVSLSDRDRERFLAVIGNPPAATPALRNAASRHRARRV